LGHAGSTLKRPQLIRPVVQAVIYVVVEVMEQLYFARRAIVFDRSFFRSLLFAALIVQIVSSDLVVEIF
jgi:hypothetical protein